MISAQRASRSSGFERKRSVRVGPSNEAGTASAPQKMKRVSGGCVYMVVDDVDGLHDELRQRSVPIDLEPTDQTWGNREMYVRDPDGNFIRLIHPLSR